MRQLHILFNWAKTWHVIVCWCLCFSPNLPELIIKLFWTSEQNNFGFSSGKFRGKHKNQHTITCQVLAELNKIWSCLIFIKLYCCWLRIKIGIWILTEVKKVKTVVNLSFEISKAENFFNNYDRTFVCQSTGKSIWWNFWPSTYLSTN